MQSRSFLGDNGERRVQYTAASRLGRAVAKFDALQKAANDAAQLKALRENELANVTRAIDALPADTEPADLAPLLALADAHRALAPKVATHASAANQAFVEYTEAASVSRRVVRALDRLDLLTDDSQNTNQSPAQRRREIDEKRGLVEELTGVSS